MQTLEDKPVTVSGLLLTLALAALAVAAYYFKMTSEAVALWAAVLTALSGLLAWWVSSRTTPQAKPADTDGTPLVRADDGQPSARAAQAGRFVVRAPTPRGADADTPLPAVRWSK